MKRSVCWALCVVALASCDASPTLPEAKATTEPSPSTPEGGEILCQFTAGPPSEPWRDKLDIRVNVRGDELAQNGEVIRQEVVGPFRVLLGYNHDGSRAPRFGFSVGDVASDRYTLGGYSSEFSMDGDGSVVLPVNQIGSGFTGTGRVAHPSSNDYLTYYCRTL